MLKERVESVAIWLCWLIYSSVEDWGVLSAVEDWVMCLDTESINLLSALDLVHVSKCDLILRSRGLWKASVRFCLQGRYWDTMRLFLRQEAKAEFSVQFLCLPYLSLSLKPLIPCAILSDVPGNSCFTRNKINPRKHIPYSILIRNTLTCISFHWVM